MTETQQDLIAFEKLAQMRESFLKEIGKVVIAVSYTHLTLPTILLV